MTGDDLLETKNETILLFSWVECTHFVLDSAIYKSLLPLLAKILHQMQYNVLPCANMQDD